LQTKSRTEILLGFFTSTLAYKKALEQANANLKKAADSGVTIAFGTDTGPAARFQGYFEHMELSMMAEAGLTPEQILRSATGDAARCLGLGEVGTIESGKVGRLRRPPRRPARGRREDAEHRFRLDLGKSSSSGRERVARFPLSRAAFLFQLDEAGEEGPLREVADVGIDVGIDPPEKL
jgi:hypothetical protein